MVTGIDLVREQVRVAAGEKLNFRQEDIVHRGVAIECRINAEDPAADFRPSPGTVNWRWQVPGGPGVRLDSHVTSGYRVPPNYDSLDGEASRLSAHPNGSNCVHALVSAEFKVEGVKTTIPIHREIFNHSAFIEGRVDTTFIERNWQKS